VQLIRLLAASITVRRLIRTHQIEAVFTTGGYIAAPAILGARWCGCLLCCMNRMQSPAG
jgi:UDP-N-acetylglucosamine--N-acetylmuramyl-(pentapeptide) pyrophosphoryl-undecaprenol N-acetylglucosamine transferase